MKKIDTFTNAKIKMVMRLRGLTRRAAMRALKQEGPTTVETKQLEPCDVSRHHDDIKLISAEEFFSL